MTEPKPKQRDQRNAIAASGMFVTVRTIDLGAATTNQHTICLIGASLVPWLPAVY